MRKMFSEKQIEKMISEGQKSPKFVEIFNDTITTNDAGEIELDIQLDSSKLYRIKVADNDDNDSSFFYGVFSGDYGVGQDNINTQVSVLEYYEGSLLLSSLVEETDYKLIIWELK